MLGKLDREKTNSLKEMFKRFSNNFEDNEECIIIIDEIQESYKIYNIIRQFARVFEDCINAIIEILARGKKGIKESSYTKELQQIITKQYSNNITKENGNRLLQWFYTSRFVKDCDKLIDFDFTNIKKDKDIFYQMWVWQIIL